MIRLLRIAMLLALLAPGAAGRDYCFDRLEGKDTNAGTKQAPMRSLDKLATLALKPGDRVFLRRGRTFRGKLAINGSGANGKPIIVAAYGDGPKPEILGSIRLKGWRKGQNAVWSAKVPKSAFRGVPEVFGVFEYEEDKAPRRLLRDTDVPVEPGRFYFDPAISSVYIRTHDDTPPRKRRVEVCVVETLCELRERNHLDLTEVALLFANRQALAVLRCKHVTVADCAVMCSGEGGMPNVAIQGGEKTGLASCFVYDSDKSGVSVTDDAKAAFLLDVTVVGTMRGHGVVFARNPRVDRLSDAQCSLSFSVVGLCAGDGAHVEAGAAIIAQSACYGNGRHGACAERGGPGCLVSSNICFRNGGAGIHLAAPRGAAEGLSIARGNLVYGNRLPGIEVRAREAAIRFNTVLSSLEAPSVRFDFKTARKIEFVSNVVADPDSGNGFPLVEFVWGGPDLCLKKAAGNVLWSGGRPEDQWIRTDEDEFSLPRLAKRYGLLPLGISAKPGLTKTREGYYFASARTHAWNAGWDGNLGGPESAYMHMIDRKITTQYPRVWLTGKDDDAAVLHYWGKRPIGPPKAFWPYMPPTKGDDKGRAKP